jgi:ribosomal protein L11 methylase PrmA
MVRIADVKDLSLSQTFDLVAANLVSPDLIEFRERIENFVKPGGYLIISGVSLKNIPKVRKAFTHSSLKLLKLVKGREWAAFLLRSKSESIA